MILSSRTPIVSSQTDVDWHKGRDQEVPPAARLQRRIILSYSYVVRFNELIMNPSRYTEGQYYAYKRMVVHFYIMLVYFLLRMLIKTHSKQASGIKICIWSPNLKWMVVNTGVNGMKRFLSSINRILLKMVYSKNCGVFVVIKVLEVTLFNINLNLMV